MNSKLGRYGLKLDKNITELVSKDVYMNILSTRKVYSEITFDSDNILVTYDKELDLELIQKLDLDINKLKGKISTSDIHPEFKNVSVAISAAVTAYARIFMAQTQLDILKKGNNIFYTDTDSIVTDKPLNPELVDPKILGKFKLEYNGLLKEGYFLANKFYCLVDNQNKLIKKTKGIDSDTITLEDYKNMYINQTPIQGSRTESSKHFIDGYVKIFEKDLVISPFSYTKREKIFNSEGL
jgi:hypothetical protein